MKMNCMLDISKIFYTHYNMEKRFTYSPAMQYSDSKAPSNISFQEFQNSGRVYSQGYQPVSYQQVQLPNVYTASMLPPRQITFGHEQTLAQQGSTQPVRITFNNSGAGMFSSQPLHNSQKILANPKPESPVAITASQKYSSSQKQLLSANPFLDTTDFKSIKEEQFTGCFHCFSPVTYSTKPKKGLCS